MEITVEELATLWSKWIKDKDLQQQRFGQFVCNRKLKPGYTWVECFYASTNDAWEMLFKLATGKKAFSGKKVVN